MLGTYRFDKYLKEKSPKRLDALAVSEPERRSQAAAEEGMRAGETWAAATCLARDLVNEPANVVTPAYLARRAQEIARAGRLGLKVLERADCAKLGMGAYVGVAQGSHEPPKFIHLTYKPKGRARKRVVVIGKGITFDSGGLDLKPADGMYRMKDDMSGAAAVLGLFQALPKLALPVEVHGLIAATENMPSGTAQRPGDVVRAMNGLTIEIGNTDAEGRLTLADALAYAAKEIKPDEMVDLATLTGAIVVALGMGLSGVFATDDGLAGRVLGAAEAAGREDVADAAARRVQGRASRARSPTSTTSRASAAAAPSWPASSCATSPAAARGRTSTSRAPPSPSASCRSGPRAARASASARSWRTSRRSPASGRCPAV